MSITDRLSGKKILIWGYGREGRSTEAFLKERCDGCDVTIYEGGRDGFDLQDYDLVIKSPGIACFEADPRLTSQTQLFLEEFSDRVAGITGTKGKSTTASLLYHAINGGGKKAVLVGNIGLPCLDHFGELKEQEDAVVVFEMSCHQLCNVTISPHVGVILNLYEEHLDYYGSPERYYEAKKNIARFQKKGDILYHGENLGPLPGDGEKRAAGSKERFDLKIPGEHNQYNAGIAYEIATSVFGADKEGARRALESFEGLAHRLQYLGVAGGIRYYDDSISTIPEAAISAAGAVEGVDTMLIGGMDRGIDYSLLLDFMKKRPDISFICMYASGRRIYDRLGSEERKHVFFRDELASAAALAREITREGRACILSPAAASYDHFKNFEERGDRFRELVMTEGKDI